MVYIRNWLEKNEKSKKKERNKKIKKKVRMKKKKKETAN